MATTTNDGSGATDVSGTWASTTNAYDGSATTYATTSNTNTTHVLDVTGYNFGDVVGMMDTLVSVQANVSQFVGHQARWDNPTVQAYNGTTALGTAVTLTERTLAGNEDVTLNGVTLTDIRSPDFKVRFSATRTSATGSTICSFGWANVTVNYTPKDLNVRAGVSRISDGSVFNTGIVKAWKPTATVSDAHRAVAYDGTSILATFGSGGRSRWTTDNGKTWSTAYVNGVAGAAGPSGYDIKYGGGWFVAVGASGNVWITQNPDSGWTEINPTGGAATFHYAVGYGNGWWFLAWNGGQAYINGNPNGTWTSTTGLLSGNPLVECLYYDGGTWYAGTAGAVANFSKSGNPDASWTATSWTAAVTDMKWNGTNWMFSSSGAIPSYSTAWANTPTAITEPSGLNGVYTPGNGIVWDGSNWRTVYSKSPDDHRLLTASSPSGTWTVTGPLGYSGSTTLPYETWRGYNVASSWFIGSGYGYYFGNINMEPALIKAGVGISPSTVAATAAIGSPTITSSATAQSGGPGVNFFRGNATFTANVTGWDGNADASISWSSTEGRTAPGAMEVVSTAGDVASARVMQTNSADNRVHLRNERIVYSFWIKTTTATSVTVAYQGNGGTGTIIVTVGHTVTAGVWSRVAQDYLRDDLGLNGVRFGFRTATADTYYVDDFMVEYKSAVPASDFVINTAVPCVATIGAPTVTTGGSPDATVDAATVAATATVGSPTLPAREQADTVTATTTVGAPTLATGSTITATVVAATSTVTQPSTSTDSTFSVANISVSTTVGTPTVTSSALVSVTTVAGSVAVSTPTVEQPRPYGFQNLRIA